MPNGSELTCARRVESDKIVNPNSRESSRLVASGAAACQVQRVLGQQLRRCSPNAGNEAVADFLDVVLVAR